MAFGSRAVSGGEPGQIIDVPIQTGYSQHMPSANAPTETYVVRAGDWLAKIAEKHNSTVSAIWDHPANATLRSQRGTPDVLYPGDILHIPREPRSAPPTPPAMPPPDVVPPWPYEHEKSWNGFPTWACPAEICQCELHAENARYEHTITFHDLDGHRMPNARCRVYESGKLITPEPTQTDGAGRLTVTLRASTTSLFLEWAPPNVPLARGLPYRKHYRLAKDRTFERSGHATTQLRLANLGFQEARTHRHNLEAYKRAYHMAEHVSAHQAAVQARRRHDGGTLPPFPPAPAPYDKALFESPTDAPTGSPPGVIPVQYDLPGDATEQEAGSSVPDSTNITVGVTAGGFRGVQFQCVKLSLLLRSITTPSSHPEFVGKVNTLLSHDIKNTEEHGVDFLFLKLPRGEYTAVGSVRARRGGSDVWYAGTLDTRTADGNPPSASAPDPNQSGRGWIFRSMALDEYTLSVTGPSTAYSGQTVRFVATPLGGPLGWSLGSGSKGNLGLVDAPLHHSVEYTAGPPGTATLIATDPCGQSASASITISKKLVVKKRLLVVAGTQHIDDEFYSNPANRLFFLAQAVRACREHGRRFDETTVLAFGAGYQANWLARAEKSVKGYGATFRTITSWDDVVNYVNAYKVTGTSEDTYHRIETMTQTSAKRIGSTGSTYGRTLGETTRSRQEPPVRMAS